MDGTIHTWGSWSRMMSAYRKVTGLVGGPKLLIFGMKGKPADYQAFRYGFGSALLGDAYFDLSDGTSGSVYKPAVHWFDEYAPEGRTTSWLGAAIDQPPTEPWKDGVWRRRFEGGMVLVNPRGNGARAVGVEPGYRRIRGTQAPAINTGAAVSTVSLRDRDALVLVRAAGIPDDPCNPAARDTEAAIREAQEATAP
jgi:hypothetical protein